MSKFDLDTEPEEEVSDLVIGDEEIVQNLAKSLEKNVSKKTTQKLLLTAIKEWDKTTFKHFLGTKSDEPGEIICSNIKVLDSDPTKLVIFCGINPGKDHSYSIRQNISHHVDGNLPINRSWISWDEYCRGPGIVVTKLFPKRFTYKGETKEEHLPEDIQKMVLYTNSSFFRTVDQEGVTPEHLAVSSPLLMQMVNMVKFPIIAFGKVPGGQIAKLYNMYQIAEYPSGWSNWKIRFYENDNNMKMIQVPHFKYIWALKAPEETWDAMRTFFHQ
jgi:hypothetical protein